MKIEALLSKSKITPLILILFLAGAFVKSVGADNKFYAVLFYGSNRQK